MPTKFTDIYDRAVFRFSDYSFLGASDENKDALLEKYLLSAITDFQHVCSVDLTDYDIQNKRFNIDLDAEIIDILSWGIAYYWINGKTLNSELLRNAIHSKDYTSYSPANLLKEIQELRNTTEREFKGRIRSYSYVHGNINTWKA